MNKFTVLKKYFYNVNIFLKKFAKVSLKYIKIHKYLIKLKNSKQLFYKHFYSFGLVKKQYLLSYIKKSLN